jgi:hypothetical protein
MSRRKNHNEDQIDPRLYEKLDLLRTTSPRNPEAAARGRVKFLAELETLELPSPQQARKGILPGWMTRRTETKVAYAGSRTARFSLSGAFLLIALLAFLFGGAGMTAYAAQSALPGDILYPVKTGLEQTQLAFSTNPAARTELQMEFAEHRLSEIARLIEEGQFQEIPAATDQFEVHIRNVMADLEDITTRDPQQATELSAQVSDALTRYAYELSNMLEQVPEAVQVEMMRTIQNTWLTGNIGEILFNGAIDSIGPQAWVISGQAVAIHTTTEVRGTFTIGDVVQVRAVRNADGSLAAREIERVLAGMEGGGGANQSGDGEGGADAGMSGSGLGEGDPSGNADQSQGQPQNNPPSDGQDGEQFQKQTQDPNYQGPGSGNDDGQDQSPKQNPGQDSGQVP